MSTGQAIVLCVGAIVVDADERLLLIRRGQAPEAGSWSVPGGRVEPGETLPVAVLRELFEETGIEGLCGELAGWVERIDEDSHVVILDFHVTVLDSVDPIAGDDATEAEWVPLSEVGERQLVDGLGQFLVDVGVLDRLI